MLTAHEIFGFMSPVLAAEIIANTHEADKQIYRAVLAGIAEAKKVRPVFLERKPRADQHKEVVTMLSKPRLDALALQVLQNWLLKHQPAMLADFLDALEIKHEKGAVEDLPEKMDDEKLKSAIDKLLAKYPKENAAVYLRAFNDLNQANWPNLAEMLDKDPRLQLGN
jgi:hypothetical protein